MQVITTHTNADFDSFASMVAAKKLYPEARVFFPGSQEKSVRRFLSETNYSDIKFEKIKKADLDKIDHIIIVDTKSPERIGKLSEIIDRPGVKVHIYDHHPHAIGEIRGELEVMEEVGATATIFTEIIQEKGIAISPLEATILALGIYEETGSLTFTSTTVRDLYAVAYLLGKGANLNIVSDFLPRELDVEQVALLNDMIHSVKNYLINGVKVVVSAISTTRYVDDLAVVVHKLKDIENIDVLFSLIQMDDRIHLIARSRIPDVNVGEVAAELGGGGHATAASATIKDLNLTQAEEKLLDVLKRRIKPTRVARDIMTFPLKTIQKTQTILEAERTMTQYGVNVLPILDGDRFVGLITREIVEQSIFHNLAESKVSDFMHTDFHQVTPETPFTDVETLMIERNQRFMPVVEGTKIVGAITRTDLLRALHEHFQLMKPQESYFSRNLRSLLRERLPQRVEDLLKKAGEVAEQMGVNAYVVGGFVRDLLLGYEDLDVDIVIEGDGIAFAGRFGALYSGKVVAHRKFGTAVIILPDGFRIDVATARTEYYEYPTALPTIEWSSIKKDLYRRDFTINTLSIKLNRKDYGSLIDFFGGRRDLKEKTIRVLHNLSFIEDPTRVFRAIRFEQRFNFKISRHTQNLIRNAVAMDLFHKLSGKRLYDELTLIFSEADPIKAVRRMTEFDLLRFIHTKLTFNLSTQALFEGIKDSLAWFKLLFLEENIEPWLVYFMGLLEPLDAEAVEEVCQRLSIPKGIVEKITVTKGEAVAVLSRLDKKDLKASDIYNLLSTVPTESIILMIAKTEKNTVKKHISLYLTELKKVKISVTGKDLLKMGVRPGPDYKQILNRVLEEKLDGRLKTRDEEINYIKEKLLTNLPGRQAGT